MSNSEDSVVKTEIVYSEEQLAIKQKNEKRRQEYAKARNDLLEKLPGFSVVFKTNIDYVKGDPKKDLYTSPEGLHAIHEAIKNGEYDSDEESEFPIFKALDVEQWNDKVYPNSTSNIKEASWYKVSLKDALISRKVVDYITFIESMNEIPKDQRDAKIILFPDFKNPPCKQCIADRKCKDKNCNKYESVLNNQLCKECIIFFEKNACKHTRKDQFLTNPVLARIVRYMQVCNGYDPVTEIESLPIYPILSKDIITMFGQSKLFTTEFKTYVENFDIGTDNLVYYQIVEDIAKAALFLQIEGLEIICSVFCASYLHKEVLDNYVKMLSRVPRPRYLEEKDYQENNLFEFEAAEKRKIELQAKRKTDLNQQVELERKQNPQLDPDEIKKKLIEKQRAQRDQRIAKAPKCHPDALDQKKAEKEKNVKTNDSKKTAMSDD